MPFFWQIVDIFMTHIIHYTTYQLMINALEISSTTNAYHITGSAVVGELLTISFNICIVLVDMFVCVYV